LGGFDEAHQQGIVELGPPVSQICDVPVVGQRRVPLCGYNDWLRLWRVRGDG
jgi:hypothetical protein